MVKALLLVAFAASGHHPPRAYHCKFHPTCVHRTNQHRRYVVNQMPTTVASWYFDSGATASGAHFKFGFASLMYGSQWGLRVRFCNGLRCVVGKMDDHGPYAGDRGFDLNPALRSALECEDLCTVHYSVVVSRQG